MKGAPNPESAAMARISALEARLEAQADPLIIVHESRMRAVIFVVAIIAAFAGAYSALALYRRGIA